MFVDVDVAVHMSSVSTIYLSIYPSIYLSVYLSIYLSVYLCMYTYTRVCTNANKHIDKCAHSYNIQVMYTHSGLNGHETFLQARPCRAQKRQRPSPPWPGSSAEVSKVSRPLKARTCEPWSQFLIRELQGRVVLFRLALSWLVQVLKSVANAAFSEKCNPFLWFQRH